MKLVFNSANHLPSVRDLCVEQKMIATVSAGVKPELFLGAKRVFYKVSKWKTLQNLTLYV